MSAQTATYADVIAAINKLEDKLTSKIEAVEKAFDQHRDTLPDVYMPRRELAVVLDGIKDQNASSAVRVTQLEAHVTALQKECDSLRLATVQDVAATRLEAKNDVTVAAKEASSLTNSLREHFDARTIALYTVLIFFLLQIILNLLGVSVHLAVKP